MRVLTQRLLTLLNNESFGSTNETIANTMIERLYELDKLTIDDLSDLCHVSKSTLSKFVRNLGFDSFKDFKLTVIEEKEKPFYKYSNTITIDKFIEKNGIQKYVEILSDDINLAVREISQEKIKKIAKMIFNSSKVAAFGTTYSETVALDFQYMMAFNKKYIYTSLDDLKQDAFIETADNDTLVIIFSNSGKYLREYQLIKGHPKKKTFNHTGAKVVLITSNKDYLSNPYVDLVIDTSFSTNLQNHPYVFRVINEMILTEYKRIIKKSF